MIYSLTALPKRARVHQPLKSVNNLIVFNQYRANFNGPIAVLRREAGSFKIKNDNGLLIHQIFSKNLLALPKLVTTTSFFALVAAT